MHYVVFSDIHGNLPAFERMLSAAGSVDGYICLGDTVDYGPWSDECVDLLLSLPNVIYLEGNHETYFKTGSYTSQHPVAQAFFDFCYPRFNKLSSISNLPSTFMLGGYTFAHTIMDQYIYPDSTVVLDTNYVVGHSHHQFVIDQGKFKLYNPGSVGQNRGILNIIQYDILDTDTMLFEPYSISYDVEPVIQALRDQAYPQICIDYYASKPQKRQ